MRVIYTSRNQYVNQEAIRTRMTKGLQTNEFQELWLAPFNSDQIDGYIVSWIKTKSSNQSPGQVRQKLDSIKGLADFIVEPLVLRMALEIQKLLESKWKGKLIRLDTYEYFANQYFEHAI